MQNGFKVVMNVLVLILCFGVLASMLLPAFSTIRSGSKISCKNNLRNIGLNMLNYNQSEGMNRYFPTGYDADSGNHDLCGRQFVVSLWNPHDSDLRETKIYVCPENPYAVSPTNSLYDHSGNLGSVSGSPPIDTELIDTNYYGWDENAAIANGYRVTRAGTEMVVISDQDGSGDARNMNHADGINCLFGDGHVEFGTYKGGFVDVEKTEEGYQKSSKAFTPKQAGIVLPTVCGDWSGAYRCNFISKAGGEPIVYQERPLSTQQKKKIGLLAVACTLIFVSALMFVVNARKEKTT